MESLRYNTLLRMLKLLNVALLTLPFGICWYLAYADEIAAPFYRKGNFLIVALFAILYVTYGRIYEAFRVSLSPSSELVMSQVLAAGISDIIMYVIIWILTRHFPAVWPLFCALIAQGALSALWSYSSNRWYFHHFQAKKTAIIYEKRENFENLIAEYGLQKKFNVVASSDFQTAFANNLEILKDVEAVFLCEISSHERNIVLKHCIANGIQVYLIPKIGDVLMSGAKQMHMFHLPMMLAERYNPNPEYLLVKRAFDIVVSALAMIISSPVMLCVAIAIKATDGGPVFYRQCRLTKDGKTFDVLKFRSMRVDAEKDGVARLSSGSSDDRITPVGRFIRKCRIDELPQFINIFMGDMSFVGPRPERPEIAVQYEETLPEFSLRLQAKAGLTGYAQVYGKYNTTPYDKLQMDLMYIANPNVAEDLKIMFAAVKILFKPESTEGVQQGQTTAAK